MKIETGRLILRSARSDDARKLLALFSDPEVLRFLPPLKQPLTLERIERSIERRQELESRLGFPPLVVEERDGGEFVGNAGLQPVEKSSEIEIAYHLLPSMWGKGYATEAAKALVRFGFESAGLGEIIGLCFSDNVASARVLEKAGMKYVGLASYFGLNDLKKFVAKRDDWNQSFK